jgi:sugar/nucleoside kinase (ribokinase family)
VVGVGQISLDRVVTAPHWPRPGAKLALASAPALHPGGQVATALLAAVTLGCSGRLLGAVGGDPDADLALARLRAAGVDLAGVRRVAGAATRSALVLVDERDGERSVLGHRDARLALRSADLSREAIRTARVLLLDGEDPDAARWAVAVAREAGLACVLDLERADPDRLALARSVDFPIVSESFAAELSNSDAVEQGAARGLLEELVAAGARMAVITCGARGAFGFAHGQHLAQPAIGVDALDTTGAGDVFRGAFAWAVLGGASARRALALAAAAGGLACRGVGAQGSLPTPAELEEWAPDSRA